MAKETINLFFIGDEYYHKSKSMMSSIYIVGTFKRYDWGFVNVALREGKKVNIRPANKKEIKWANEKIGESLLNEK